MSIKIADRFYRKDTSGSAEEVFLDVHKDVLETKTFRASQIKVSEEENLVDTLDAITLDTTSIHGDISRIDENLKTIDDNIKAVYEEIPFAANQEYVDLTQEPTDDSGVIKIIDLNKAYDAVTLFLKVGRNFLEGKTIINPRESLSTIQYVNFSFLENNMIDVGLSTANTINLTLGFRISTNDDPETATSFTIGLETVNWTRIGIVNGNLRYEVHDGPYIPIDLNDELANPNSENKNITDDFLIYKVYGITAY